MIVIEGASMAHVSVSQFYALVGLAAIVPAWRGFLFIRQFLGGR